MKKFFIINILLLLVFPCKLFSQNIKIEPGKNDQIIFFNQKYYVPFKIIIPQKKYIYGNPKGPGIGKETSITVRTQYNAIIKKIHIEKPEKYYPTGELNWVWRYINEVTFYIPLKLDYFTNSNDLSLQIKIDALVCDYQSCYPIVKNKIHSINKTALTQLPENQKKELINTILLGDTPEEENNIEKLNKIIPDFKPRYLKKNPVSSIVIAIVFAIIAGFLLNFMPCVLPVISIKLLSITSLSNKEPGKVFLSGLLYTLGMLISFLILASLAAFANYNWGSLFQNNNFLIIMIIIIFVFALSLLDIFTIQMPFFALKKASKNYKNFYIDSLMKGLFTTFLATPCSGPFLGTTLTWTLTQPVYIIYIIFISIGLGMSLPYLIISFKPQLIKLVPKPGNWTNYFEKIMGFLLIGTVIYLLGILSEKIIIKTIWMLFIISISFWQYGVWANPQNKRKTRFLSSLILFLFLFAGYYFLFIRNDSNKYNDFQKKSFSLQKLIEANNQKKIAIIEFTADWCPNCKIVEANTINSNEFKNLIKENNISFFIADITKKGTEGEELLKKLNSHSIPFLAVFGTGPAFLKPYCLYDLYTYDDIEKAFNLTKKESLKKDPSKQPKLEIQTIKFK